MLGSERSAREIGDLRDDLGIKSTRKRRLLGDRELGSHGEKGGGVNSDEVDALERSRAKLRVSVDILIPLLTTRLTW